MNELVQKTAGVECPSAVCRRAVAGGIELRASQYSPETRGWSAAQRIGFPADVHGPFDVQVAMDRNGNAMAIWAQQNVLGGFFAIFVQRYAAKSGWDASPEFVD